MPDEPRIGVERRHSFLRELCDTHRPFLWIALTSVALLTAVTALSGSIAVPFQQVAHLRGVGGSKIEYLHDEQVGTILMQHDTAVEAIRLGSRAASRVDLDDYDFVFPSGQPAADLVTQRRGTQNKLAVPQRLFVSPLVLATFWPYAEALVQAGVAFRVNNVPGVHNQYYTLNVRGFVNLLREGRTWDDLKIGLYGFQNSNAVLAQTTDVCLSNSGDAYLGLVSYGYSPGPPPADDPSAHARAAAIAPLIRAQGAPTRAPEELYFSPEGRQTTPVVAMYEHQYLAYQLDQRARGNPLDTDRVLLYPDAALENEPTLIALTPRAEDFGRLLLTDPALRQRQLDLGFRVIDPSADFSSTRLAERLSSVGVPVPPGMVGRTASDTRLVLPEVPELEDMINDVGRCPP